MPGQRIKSKQIALYMNYRKDGYTQITAAAKAGFCERSARNIQNRNHQTAVGERDWRTRKDPFEDVWHSELVPLLEDRPRLQARTLLDYLQEKYPDQYPDSKLRTLERRVREWRAKNGPDKEIIFRQKHPPGRQGLSDFTCAKSLEVTINKKPLEHLLYHYRLAHSGWSYVGVILGGESFTALAENLQNALWQCGGAPETHRTDSLSAAFKNLSKEASEDQTQFYEELCAHYGMEPTRNNKGVSHENGSIESSHRHLKNRVDQALLIRGSRDFKGLDEYKQFIREIVERQNRRIHKSYLEELAHLSSLPERKTTDYEEERVRVTNSSTIYVKSIIYSVPSRLIGVILKVHIYDDRLECFLGGDHILSLPRLRKSSKSRYVSRVDYRHLIGQLSRKPGAFMNYIYRDACFPTLAFRQAWESLLENLGERRACREYVAILKVAAELDRESSVSCYLERCIGQNQKVSANGVRRLFPEEARDIPEFKDCLDSLESYDELLKEGGR